MRTNRVGRKSVLLLQLCVSAILVAAAVGLLVVVPDRIAIADDAAPVNQQHIEYGADLLIQLAVADLEKSMAFYRDVLELKLASHEPELEWAKFDTNVPGVRIGIGRQDTVAGSGSTSINIGVKNVDAARALLESRGVKFARPTINIPGVVKLADFQDPDGNRLRLAGPPDADS